MVRILLILLSLATMITAFQNCGTGGTLTLESSSIGKSGFTHLLGACSSLPAGAVCDERWSGSAADTAAFQASCNGAGVYQAFQCPRTPDLLGVCETVVAQHLRRNYFYSGYSMGAIPAGQEAANAQQACVSNQGTWQ